MRIDDSWLTAHGNVVVKDDLIASIEEHILSGGRIFVGCDSNVIGEKCTYATAICLYNESERRGGRYFYRRHVEKIRLRSPPQVRIMQEAQIAIEVALELASIFPTENIEVHLDVNTRKGHLSQTLADQLSGYAKAAGFECKLKPHSWAATGIADGHTR